eukprot:gene1869-2206_t
MVFFGVSNAQSSTSTSTSTSSRHGGRGATGLQQVVGDERSLSGDPAATRASHHLAVLSQRANEAASELVLFAWSCLRQQLTKLATVSLLHLDSVCHVGTPLHLEPVPSSSSEALAPEAASQHLEQQATDAKPTDQDDSGCEHLAADCPGDGGDGLAASTAAARARQLGLPQHVPVQLEPDAGWADAVEAAEDLFVEAEDEFVDVEHQHQDEGADDFEFAAGSPRATDDGVEDMSLGTQLQEEIDEQSQEPTAVVLGWAWQQPHKVDSYPQGHPDTTAQPAAAAADVPVQHLLLTLRTGDIHPPTGKLLSRSIATSESPYAFLQLLDAETGAVLAAHLPHPPYSITCLALWGADGRAFATAATTGATSSEGNHDRSRFAAAESCPLAGAAVGAGRAIRGTAQSAQCHGSWLLEVQADTLPRVGPAAAAADVARSPAVVTASRPSPKRLSSHKFKQLVVLGTEALHTDGCQEDGCQGQLLVLQLTGQWQPAAAEASLVVPVPHPGAPPPDAAANTAGHLFGGSAGQASVGEAVTSAAGGGGGMLMEEESGPHIMARYSLSAFDFLSDSKDVQNSCHDMAEAPNTCSQQHLAELLHEDQQQARANQAAADGTIKAFSFKRLARLRLPSAVNAVSGFGSQLLLVAMNDILAVYRLCPLRGKLQQAAHCPVRAPINSLAVIGEIDDRGGMVLAGDLFQGLVMFKIEIQPVTERVAVSAIAAHGEIRRVMQVACLPPMARRHKLPSRGSGGGSCAAVGMYVPGYGSSSSGDHTLGDSFSQLSGSGLPLHWQMPVGSSAAGAAGLPWAVVTSSSCAVLHLQLLPASEGKLLQQLQWVLLQHPATARLCIGGQELLPQLGKQQGLAVPWGSAPSSAMAAAGSAVVQPGRPQTVDMAQAVHLGTGLQCVDARVLKQLLVLPREQQLAILQDAGFDEPRKGWDLPAPSCRAPSQRPGVDQYSPASIANHVRFDSTTQAASLVNKAEEMLLPWTCNFGPHPDVAIPSGIAPVAEANPVPQLPRAVSATSTLMTPRRSSLSSEQELVVEVVVGGKGVDTGKSAGPA